MLKYSYKLFTRNTIYTTKIVNNHLEKQNQKHPLMLDLNICKHIFQNSLIE